jgi:dephospho-CoA kinase
MIKVGLTGGIGAGKSIVARILESCNYPVFNSDQVAKKLIVEDQSLRSELIHEFGDSVYNGTELDRTFLAGVIFKDETAREKINSLVHPRVRKSFVDFCENTKSPLVFNEAAILFETGSYSQFDKNILVTAPESLRIDRVMERDGLSRSAVEDRIKAQWSDERKAQLADFLIVNDEVQPLLTQVEAILEELTKLQ